MRNVVYVISAFFLLISGCAAPPKDARWAVAAFQRFLISSETPFSSRARELMGPDVSATALPLDGYARLEITPGHAIRYANVEIRNAKPPDYRGMMTAIFDTSFICIKRSDLSPFGHIYPSSPDIIHNVGGGIAASHKNPDHVNVVDKGEIISVYLMTFEGECLAEVYFRVRIVK